MQADQFHTHNLGTRAGLAYVYQAYTPVLTVLLRTLQNILRQSVLLGVCVTPEILSDALMCVNCQHMLCSIRVMETQFVPGNSCTSLIIVTYRRKTARQHVNGFVATGMGMSNVNYNSSCLRICPPRPTKTMCGTTATQALLNLASCRSTCVPPSCTN